MEGCPKTSAGAVSGLPDDPLVEILSRLPAKSVYRFKCVSKAWRDLIAHPDHRTWSQNQIDEQKEQGQLEGWLHQFALDALERYGVFVNGFLHFIVWNSDEAHILALDLQGKARRSITMPGGEDSWICYLGQSQGHLHCVTAQQDSSYKLSIWVLQNYDTKEWVLKNTVDYLDVFGETSYTVDSGLQVIDIHQDCNVVFIYDHPGSELVAYDMDRKELSVIATFDDHKFRIDFARYIPYFSESPALTNKH